MSKRSTRYLKIVSWARARYTNCGTLIVSVGGAPSIYSRIENAAFQKYMKAFRDADGCIVFGK